MSNIIIEVIREADNVLVFRGAYPSAEFSVCVTHSDDGQGQFRSNGLSEELHAGVHERVHAKEAQGFGQAGTVIWQHPDGEVERAKAQIQVMQWEGVKMMECEGILDEKDRK